MDALTRIFVSKNCRFPRKSGEIDDKTNYTKIQRFRKETILDPPRQKFHNEQYKTKRKNF